MDAKSWCALPLRRSGAAQLGSLTLVATLLALLGGCGSPDRSAPAKKPDEHAGHDHAGHDHEGHDHSDDERADDDHPAHGEAGHIHTDGDERSDHDHAHEDHDHLHADGGEHDETTSIELSPQALKNIGYEPATIGIGSYERTISLPGMVVERPGRTQIQISAPLTGIVTRIYGIEGEAIEPDSPLFDLRLTHEELVASQSEFLRLAEELDVVNREITRLESITEGVIAGRRVLEQQYERQKLEGQLRAGRQALLLHGLSESQVDEILKARELLKSLTIRAPAHEDCPDCAGDHLFHIQKLNVHLGQQITAGESLGVLADHCQLYIEGTAFEQDAERLSTATKAGANVSADLLVSSRRQHAIDGLKLLYLSDQVDRESRALHFYLPLPNDVVVDRSDGDHRFLEWRFKPGQRVELRIPVEEWQDRIVVPANAVVTNGAESYVYRQEGNHFHRVSVHIEHRDKQTAVIANDGTLKAGEIVAGHGAFQIHLALKNKSGGAVDPHAGHNH